MARYFIVPHRWKQWGSSEDWRDYVISDSELEDSISRWRRDDEHETAEKCRERLMKDLIEIDADFDAIEQGYVEDEE